MLAYNSFWNQLFHMLHFLFAFWLLSIAFPKFLFADFTTDRFAQWFANYMKMVVFLVALTYVLVLTKLYEVISVTAVILFVAVQRHMRGRSAPVREQDSLKWISLIYDYFEGLIELRAVAWDWLRTRKAVWLADLKRLASSWPRVALLLLLAVTLCIAIYIRFYDAVTSAVPGTSDGNVTLAWMKYIDSRILFHDGFYPAGFHMVLAFLLKYANIDALYILKYAGPLNMMLICIGYYFVVSRITGSKVAGGAALLVFGLLCPLFYGPVSYIRQAATNSQEFTFVFVFPSLYFYLQYLREGNKGELLAAASGTTAIGLAHEIAFAWVGVGMILMLALQTAMNGWRERGRMLYVASTGVASAVVIVIPLLLSIVLNAGEHATTINYATAKITDLHPNPIRTVDVIAVGAAGFAFLITLLKINEKKQRLPELFFALFVGMTFLIYKYAYLTDNEAISDRSSDIWYLCIPLAAGLAWHAVFSIFAKLRWRMALELAACTAALASVLYLVPPKAIITDKLEGEEAVRQYLRISSQFLPKTFLIVSPRVQEYGIVLGKGSHMYLKAAQDSLLSDYDPTKEPLTRYGEDKYAPVPQNIFIYYEKHVYGIDAKNMTEQRKVELQGYQEAYAELQDWLKKYEATHSGEERLQVYYDDPDFTVYYLHRKDDHKEILNQIWS